MLEKLNPFVRFIEKKQSIHLTHEIAAHDCRLIYVLEGSCDILFDGKRQRLKEGDALYLPPYTLHTVRGSSEALLLIVHFDLTDQNKESTVSMQNLSCAELASSVRLPYDMFAPFESAFSVHAVDLCNLLDCMKKSIVLPSPYARDHASSMMKEILLLLIEEMEKENFHSSLTRKIIDYVYLHYADAEITNQDIAALFGYHPYHISRIMRKETGKTLKAFIISYRLKVAANMLILTDMTMADIAHACGFESQSYFSKMFREEFLTTPGEYRKTHTGYCM